jgi:CRISPR-associated endonuclease/helicase Cas3/CRISPR-associated endonuclease Cas3-HD
MECGEIFVFRSTEPYGKAQSWQQRVAEIASMIFKDHPDPLSLPAIEDYFGQLYYHIGKDRLDSKAILPALEERSKELAFPFEDINDKFRLIEEKTQDVIIPYDDSARSIIDHLRETEFPGRYMRQLQGYTVSIYAREFEELEHAGRIDTISERYHVLTDMAQYSEKTGLQRVSSDDHDMALLLA